MMASSSAAPRSSQKELEEKLRQSGIKLSTPPSASRELLSLLEKVESELKSIEQDPSESMRNLVEPIRKALIGTKLLGHSDEIIEVSVVSCICEIMRITAPYQPYDDEEMKEIFHHIMSSLEKLPNVVSRCYSKAERVLAGIAKVRGCVMLLDLDHVLALNIFQLFLKIIRPYHPHDVLTNMEEIMTQLIEESDEVSMDLLLPLLESLRKRTQDVAPLSSVLGHHVVERCAARLKPCLLEAIKTMSLTFDDYSDVLGSICHEALEGENMVENAGVVFPVEGTSAVKLPEVLLLDGTPKSMNNDNNNQEPDGSLKTLKRCHQAEQLKDTNTPSDPMHKNTKDLEQQINLSGLPEKIKPNKGIDCFGMNESKRCVEEPYNKKENEKKSGSASENAASKESALPSETGKQSMPDVLSPNSASTGLPSSTLSRNAYINSGTSRRRGRPKKNQSELTLRKGSEGTRSSKGKRGRGSCKDEASASVAVIIKKEEETLSGEEKSSLQQNNLRNISTITKRLRKQALNKEKDSKRLRITKDYGEELIGANVRVWWPLDRKFYEGVITSFDPEMKKHTVEYADGDVEILNLNHERWEMLEGVSVKREPVTDFPPVVCSGTGKKKTKGSSKKKESGASSPKRSGKKVRGSGSTPGKIIKSDKAPAEDNNTTNPSGKLNDNNKNNPRIKEEAEEVTVKPSETYSEVKNFATDA